ncbi:hypothetical protein vBSAP01_223 [Staphylococcus phage vB_SAP01]|nr:hypothetical protein vBSAP01_223 [Staphylococcus phage vB_SAP01]
MDSKKLIQYFGDRQGKKIILEDGSKVKLYSVNCTGYSLELTFLYDNETMAINIDNLYSDYVLMHIPKGLYPHTVVKHDSSLGISFVLEKSLSEWVRQVKNDLVFGLEWED